MKNINLFHAHIQRIYPYFHKSCSFSNIYHLLLVMNSIDKILSYYRILLFLLMVYLLLYVFLLMISFFLKIFQILLALIEVFSIFFVLICFCSDYVLRNDDYLWFLFLLCMNHFRT